MASVANALARAFELHQSGCFDEAEDLYGRILAVAPIEPEALHRHGLLVAQLGRLEEAASQLRRAVAVDPQPVEPHVNRAKLLHALGKHEAAERAFARALALCPDLAEAQDGLGRARRALGNLNGAATAFGRAALSGGGAASFHHQGMALETAGRRWEAVEALERAAGLDPQSGPVAARIGMLLLGLGEAGRAGRWYRRALVLRPGHADTLRGMAAAAEAMGDREAAERGRMRVARLLERA